MRDLHDPFLRPDDFQDGEELQNPPASWMNRQYVNDELDPEAVNATLDALTAWVFLIFGLLIFFACMFLAFWTAGN